MYFFLNLKSFRYAEKVKGTKLVGETYSQEKYLYKVKWIETDNSLDHGDTFRHKVFILLRHEVPMMHYETITSGITRHRHIAHRRHKFYRKIHCLTSEFHVKFHGRNRYCTNREATSAISVFQVKFNVEFTRQAVNFS